MMVTLRVVPTVTLSREAFPGSLLGVPERRTELLGEVDHACHSCGGGCAVALETHPVPRFLDRFRRNVDRRVRRYETCLDCGTTVRVRRVNGPLASGWDPFDPGCSAL